MIIELPEKYYKAFNGGYVQVRNDILEIHGYFTCKYESIMIDLAYQIHGHTRCNYCGKTVEPNKITIDHLFSRNFGGITVTSNLRPTCQKCNSDKANMNQAEFQVWKTIKSKNERKKFYKGVIEEKLKRKRDPNNPYGFDLPKQWVTYVPIDVIEKVNNINVKGSKRYNRMMNFVNLYGKLPRTVTLSLNNILLNGETLYAVAQKRNIERVPAVILENVMWFEN